MQRLRTIQTYFLVVLILPMMMNTGYAADLNPDRSPVHSTTIDGLRVPQTTALDATQGSIRETTQEEIRGTTQEAFRNTIQEEIRGTTQEEIRGTTQEAFRNTTQEESRGTTQEAFRNTTQEEIRGTTQEAFRDTIQETEPSLFGMHYFEPARNRIQEMEIRIAAGQWPDIGSQYQTTMPSAADATTDAYQTYSNQSGRKSAIHSYVGPLEMVSSPTHMTVPRGYILSAGDILKASLWSKSIDPIETRLLIDEQGFVTIPKLGKILAQGLTLEKFQDALSLMIEKSVYKYMRFIVTLDQLKSIQVSIRGEAFRPGNYAVSAATTLFNALHACGGVTEIGSLRNIRLLRGRKTIHIDFYDFLLTGSNHDDILLKSGDIIQIPLLKKSVTVQGEVVRPVVYELKAQETLADLLDMAGGIKPTGLRSRIQIETVLPNRERRLLDVNLDRDQAGEKTELHHGDMVTINPILDEIKNTVFLEGAVEQPGVFELKAGMRVADLFSKQNPPLEEAYFERTDILRFRDKGKTSVLIPIRLDRALEKDPEHNILLHERDQVIVYSKWDAQYITPRIISIYGAVQRPGEYRRPGGMDLKTAIFVAGGLIPGYYNTVEVVRSGVGDHIEIISKDVDRLLEGDTTQNVVLQDNDVVMIKKRSEFFDKPLLVTVTGEVKYPGVYALKTRDDRISHILERAGGLIDSAYLKGTVFKRKKRQILAIETRRDLEFVNQMFDRINELEYDRQYARNRYLWGEQLDETEEPIISETAALGIAAASNISEETAKKTAMAPGIAKATSKATSSAVEAVQKKPSVVSKARILGRDELLPTERVILDMERALSSPTAEDNLILMDGDSIDIPRRPTTVDVIGAVIRPRTITHQDSATLADYINQAGGYNHDANVEKAVVFRVDGSIIPTEKISAVETGDIIYVPTKPMTLEIETTTDKIIDTVKFSFITLTSYWVLIAILAL